MEKLKAFDQGSESEVIQNAGYIGKYRRRIDRGRKVYRRGK
jgi:hypothetical protein